MILISFAVQMKNDALLLSSVSASWIIPIDNLMHLVLTMATLMYLVYRWYCYAQDRKKQKDLDNENEDFLDGK